MENAKRGRYKTKRTETNEWCDLITPEEKSALTEKLYKEMLVKGETTRRMLAEAAVTLYLQQLAIARRIENGTATSEETKVLAAVISNLRRVMESGGSLKTLIEVEDDDIL